MHALDGSHLILRHFCKICGFGFNDFFFPREIIVDLIANDCTWIDEIICYLLFSRWWLSARRKGKLKLRFSYLKGFIAPACEITLFLQKLIAQIVWLLNRLILIEECKNWDQSENWYSHHVTNFGKFSCKTSPVGELQVYQNWFSANNLLGFTLSAKIIIIILKEH